MLTDKQNFLNGLMEAIREGLEDKCDRPVYEMEEELKFEDKLVHQFIEEIIVKYEGLEFRFTTESKVTVEE